MQRLIVPDVAWNALRADLLATPDHERAAVGFAGISRYGERLLLREWQAVPKHEYLVQLAYHLEVSPVVWARAAKRAAATGEAIVIFHSHPRDEDAPAFSPSDDAGEDLLIPKLRERAPVPVAAVVVSPGGHQARLHDMRGTGRLELSLANAPQAGVRDDGLARFARQVLALGRQGQAAVRALRVGIVGAGGLGSHVAQQLAHLGVGELLVVDPDLVDETNLSRLVGASRRDVLLRRSKVAAIAPTVRRLHSPTKVTALRASALDEEVARRFLSCDVVMGCTDTQWSRLVLNSIAFQYYVPVIDLGVELQPGAMGGRVTWLRPGGACLWCGGVLDSVRVRAEQLPPNARQAEIERGYIPGLDEPAPAVVSINGVVASLATTELLAWVTGFAGEDRPTMLLYRLSDGTVRRTRPQARNDCATCSPIGDLGAGDLVGAPWRPSSS